MLVINDESLQDVNGGKFHLGATVSSLMVGFMAGGPIGLGFAASAVIMANGIDNLHDLYKGD